MRRSLYTVVLVLAVAIVATCKSPPDEKPSKDTSKPVVEFQDRTQNSGSTTSPLAEQPQKVTSKPIVEFQDRIQSTGSITFRSWNGKALRTDSDTELTFFNGNVVHMFEWGYSLLGYSGTYQVQPSGEITIQFQGFNHPWPEMLLDRDATSLLLRPTDPKQGFVMGTRGAATLMGFMGTYWPFRMLTGDAEQGVLKMIKEREHR